MWDNLAYFTQVTRSITGSWTAPARFPCWIPGGNFPHEPNNPNFIIIQMFIINQIIKMETIQGQSTLNWEELDYAGNQLHPTPPGLWLRPQQWSVPAWEDGMWWAYNPQWIDGHPHLYPFMVYNVIFDHGTYAIWLDGARVEPRKKHQISTWWHLQPWLESRAQPKYAIAPPLLRIICIFVVLASKCHFDRPESFGLSVNFFFRWGIFLWEQVNTLVHERDTPRMNRTVDSWSFYGMFMLLFHHVWFPFHKFRLPFSGGCFHLRKSSSAMIIIHNGACSGRGTKHYMYYDPSFETSNKISGRISHLHMIFP